MRLRRALALECRLLERRGMRHQPTAALAIATRVPSKSKTTITRRLPATLTAGERESVARFVTRFIAYPRAKLDAVLDAADYVWLCHDDAGNLVGTTAVRLLPVRVRGRAARVIYTSMVAVDPAHRGTSIITTLGARSYLIERVRAPLVPLYWLALSASPSGYLQMARHMDTFWPRAAHETPDDARQVIAQSLAFLGITKIEEVEGCIRLPDDFGVSDRQQDPKRWDRSDPDVAFFLRVNPDYQRGSDLACVCRLDALQIAGGVARAVTRRVRSSPRRRTAPPAVVSSVEARA